MLPRYIAKKWSRDDLRTYIFRRFAFVSEFNSKPQRYNGISKIDDIIPRREHIQIRLVIRCPLSPVRIGLLCSVNLDSFTLELMSSVKKERSLLFSVNDNGSLLPGEPFDVRQSSLK